MDKLKTLHFSLIIQYIKLYATKVTTNSYPSINKHKTS